MIFIWESAKLYGASWSICLRMPYGYVEARDHISLLLLRSPDLTIQYRMRAFPWRSGTSPADVPARTNDDDRIFTQAIAAGSCWSPVAAVSRKPDAVVDIQLTAS